MNRPWYNPPMRRKHVPSVWEELNRYRRMAACAIALNIVLLVMLWFTWRHLVELAARRH